MRLGQGGLLEGVVEIDETYVGGKPRKANDVRKRGRGSRRGRGTAKTAVLGVVERGGSVRAKMSESITRDTIRQFVRLNVSPRATVYSDNFRSYRGIAHRQVDHRKHFVSEDGLHTNTIESFWAVVKRGVFGQFHHVTRSYLDNYLAEFSYKFNRRNVQHVFDELVQWMVVGRPVGRGVA